MAEHLVKIPCHIVFILKLYSKFLLGLFHCPAYLQLAPLPEELCSSGNAADYQWSIGIMGLSPLRGSLRAAPSKKRRKYHYTRHLHRRKQPHHTTVIALRWSLTPFREVLASEAVLLRRSGKIRSTELFSCQGTAKEACSPSSHYNGHFFAFCLTLIKKIFYIFPECSFLPLIPLTCPHETLLHSLAWSNP